MRRVILESPYAGDTDAVIERNVRYARACLRDSLLRGEAPIASHLLYTQPGVLQDKIPAERQHGIDAGLAWRSVADATVVYVDLGTSRGMGYGITAATKAGLPIEIRTLEGWELTRPANPHGIRIPRNWQNLCYEGKPCTNHLKKWPNGLGIMTVLIARIAAVSVC